MKKLDICDHCLFCAHTPHLVCAVHPSGVAGDECLDFRHSPDNDPTLAFYEPVEEWQPLGAATYGDEVVRCSSVKRFTDEQRLELLDTHPLFTGRCPNCEMPLHEREPARVHWDCEHCGWMDDAV